MTTLVIGAAGTIGRACVEELLAAGHSVVAADLKQPDIPGAEGAAVDVGSLTSVEHLVSKIEATGPITGLIYAAGTNFTGFVDQTNWDQYQKLFTVNLQGAFHIAAAIQARARSLSRTFACAFISSTAGLKGEAGGAVYVATKFGLIGFVESFAAEISQLGGRANVVCPGNVDSPMLRKLAIGVADREGRTETDVLAEFAASSSFNRLITPSEVAKTCSWLIGPESTGLSGQTIVVDGAPA